MLASECTDKVVGGVYTKKMGEKKARTTAPAWAREIAESDRGRGSDAHVTYRVEEVYWVEGKQREKGGTAEVRRNRGTGRARLLLDRNLPLLRRCNAGESMLLTSQSPARRPRLTRSYEGESRRR